MRLGVLLYTFYRSPGQEKKQNNWSPSNPFNILIFSLIDIKIRISTYLLLVLHWKIALRFFFLLEAKIISFNGEMF